MSDRQKMIIRGFGWSTTERIVTQGIRFALSFVIARQLLPADYGLIAMLSIFLAIAQSFIDSGFSQALIQKKDRSQTDYSTVFFFNIVVAFVLYILLVLSSPFIASFYHQEILKKIIVFTGLNFIINSFSTVQVAKLTVELNFKAQAQAAIISTICSGIIAVWMAYNDYGVWTLVWQSLISTIIYVVTIWIASKWKPSLEFSLQSFKRLFSFGNKLLLGGLLHTVYTNLYSLVIGKYYNASDLGLFGNASTLAQFPSRNVTEIVQKVIYPIECEIQSDDDALESLFFKTIKIISLFLFPIMLGLAAICEPLIRLILTDKWIDCVPFIRILCLAFMWSTIQRLNYTLLCAKGKSNYTLNSEIIKKIAAIVILIVTLPFGISIMCWGLVLYAFADIFITTIYTKKTLAKVTFQKEMNIMMPIFIISVVMGILVFLTTIIISNLWLSVLGSLAVGIISYLSIIKIFYNPEIKYICNLLKK